MTTDSRRADARQAALMSSSRVEQKGNIVVKWITSTDHKTIGYMYLIASVLFFLLGGVMALAIRAELFAPGMQIVPRHNSTSIPRIRSERPAFDLNHEGVAEAPVAPPAPRDRDTPAG